MAAVASTYNARTGGVNILFANRMISLILPRLPKTTPANTLRVLDNAAGPLTITNEIVDLTESSSSTDGPFSNTSTIHIDAVDLSPHFINSNKECLSQRPLRSGLSVSTAVMDAQDLKFDNNIFDVSFFALAIFALPDAPKGVQELYRTLKPGGVVCASSWKNVGWTPLLRRGEKILGREVSHFAGVEKWMEDGKLAGALSEGGFEEVEEKVMDEIAWWPSKADFGDSVVETIRLMAGLNESEVKTLKEGLIQVLDEREEAERLCVVFEEGGRVGCRMENFVATGVKK